MESVLLAVLGALLGSAAAFASIGGLRHLAGAMSFPRVDHIALNPFVLGVTLLAALLTGIASGPMPALKRSPAGIDPGPEGRRAGFGRRRGLRGLVVAEVGLSLAAGRRRPAAAQFPRTGEDPPGFNPEHALTLVLSLSETRYPTNDARLALYQRASRAVRPPRTEATGLTDFAPLEKNRPAGSSAFPTGPRTMIPALMPTMTIAPHVIFGRRGFPCVWAAFFEPADIAQHRRLAIINEAMVRACFAGESPSGRKLSTAAWTRTGSSSAWSRMCAFAGPRPSGPTRPFSSAASANERPRGPDALAIPWRRPSRSGRPSSASMPDPPVAGVRTLVAVGGPNPGPAAADVLAGFVLRPLGPAAGWHWSLWRGLLHGQPAQAGIRDPDRARGQPQEPGRPRPAPGAAAGRRRLGHRRLRARSASPGCWGSCSTESVPTIPSPLPQSRSSCWPWRSSPPGFPPSGQPRSIPWWPSGRSQPPTLKPCSPT